MSPLGMANLDPRGMVGRIYEGEHWTLLNKKYLSAGPYDLREEVFLSFSNYKPLRANDPQGMANLDHRSMVGRIFVGDHLTLLHTKYLSSGPHGFRGDDFFSFSHYKSMGVICWHGNKNSNPISPKILYSLSLHLIMLYMKFHQDWPSGIRDILIWNCGRTTTDDGRQSIGILIAHLGLMVSEKKIFKAFPIISL